MLIEAGKAAIETIEAGDKVWAWDEETGDVSLKEVVETYINETDELVHVWVKGEEIVATPSHPFYSPVKGWTDAVQLRAGDILVLVNGEYVVVEKVQHELLESPIKVYNFQVEDYHTYYVSDAGVLVHNSCKPSNSKNYSAEEIANRYNITVEQYHKQVKPEIIRQSPPKTHIVGHNPNIMLTKAGEIGYQGAKGKGFQDAMLKMSNILSQLGLG